MLKKSSIFCCYGSLPLFGSFPISSRPSTSPPPIRENRRRAQASFKQQSRQYARVRDSNPWDPENDLTWPISPTYTPYDIFKQAKGEPYSKRRFYDLVKIYHPDRPCDNPQCRDISDAVRLERYRLVISAHEILSDPTKRDAYDRYGAGWHQWNKIAGFSNGGDDVGGVNQQSHGRGEGYDDAIFKNATWEDWERWYQRHNPKRPPNYDVSHSTFASLIVLISVFAGIGQLTTLGNYSSLVDERLKEIDERCSRFLAGRRDQTLSQMDSQDARVQNFLIKRDPSGHGLKEDEEETYRKILGSPQSLNKLANIEESAQNSAATDTGIRNHSS